MATRISNVAAKAACDAVVDLLDAGAAAAYVEIRTGSAPATCEAASTGTLLATLTCSDPAFGAAADADPGAIATADTITEDSSADATGDAGYFRGFDSDDTCVIQGSVTATGGGGDMTFPTISFVAGQPVQMTSWTVTMPEA